MIVFVRRREIFRFWYQSRWKRMGKCRSNYLWPNSKIIWLSRNDHEKWSVNGKLKPNCFHRDNQPDFVISNSVSRGVKISIWSQKVFFDQRKAFLHQYYFDNETKRFEPEATFWRIVDIPVDPSIAKNMSRILKTCFSTPTLEDGLCQSQRQLNRFRKAKSMKYKK